MVNLKATLLRVNHLPIFLTICQKFMNLGIKHSNIFYDLSRLLLIFVIQIKLNPRLNHNNLSFFVPTDALYSIMDLQRGTVLQHFRKQTISYRRIDRGCHLMLANSRENAAFGVTDALRWLPSNKLFKCPAYGPPRALA